MAPVHVAVVTEKKPLYIFPVTIAELSRSPTEWHAARASAHPTVRTISK